MPLPSFLQRFRRKASPGQAADAVSLSPSDVEATRARARRRLVGMVVLVVAGLIGFPWLFETQPRTMSSDVQIVQAGGDSGSEVQISGAVPPRSPRSVAGRVAVSGIVAPPAPAEQDEPPATSAGKPPVAAVVDEPAPRVASRSVAASKPVAKPADKPAQKPADKPAEKSTDKSADKPAAKTPAKESAKEPARDAAKDKPKDAAKSGDKPGDKDKAATRYVVQFGAFADVNTAHEARMKIERLGLKTYAQQVDTPAGKRIRVRMGPYTDKADAEKAMATLRKAGLNGALLTL
ncbi:MAG: SPOR domain-containing protein [Aquabacterium sp.]|uniref:SPOR domain-containing protein n=1 Tax=Aquabacterium sp. TaxID=1872578 RepID=UPI0025C1C2E0|nr:SPOR domain-containing protein [Aquabacterium sp.]MBI3384179.1 SPOR domain-containing protein [Aquabacterium sp.]